jgi:hypothetical protein
MQKATGRREPCAELEGSGARDWSWKPVHAFVSIQIEAQIFAFDELRSSDSIEAK